MSLLCRAGLAESIQRNDLRRVKAERQASSAKIYFQMPADIIASIINKRRTYGDASVYVRDIHGTIT